MTRTQKQSVLSSTPLCLAPISPRSTSSVSSSESRRPLRMTAKKKKQEQEGKAKAIILRLTRQPKRRKRVLRVGKRVTPHLTVRNSPPHIHKQKKQTKQNQTKNKQKLWLPLTGVPKESDWQSALRSIVGRLSGLMMKEECRRMRHGTFWRLSPRRYKWNE